MIIEYFEINDNNIIYRKYIDTDDKNYVSHTNDDVTFQETYRDWETDRKSTRLNSSHSRASRMPSSA